ncbi:MAG: STT3 domain-containing protein, partial [Desulfurococcaceae archaeon]
MNYTSFLKIIDDRVNRAQRTLQEKPFYARIIVCALVILSVALGVAIRIAPMSLNGFEFFEFDSYIEYWQAKYVYENGPLAWYTLTRENPDTHIFWYPWGRDFIYTSYPLLPMWIGLSYHVVKYTGLTLQEWASLQPIIFAAVAVVLAYFAVRELTGSMIAGVLASFFMAILPAAVERSVVGFVEKEGVAAVFIFLFMYFYA